LRVFIIGMAFGMFFVVLHKLMTFEEKVDYLIKLKKKVIE